MNAGGEKKLRVLIVDDEELARFVVRELVEAHGGIEVVAECVNGLEAVKAVAEHKPDLLFLDVQMPKLTGFDVLELIGTQTPIIFVTAYDEYAMKAFEVHAVDYLLKPVGKDRLASAVKRVLSHQAEKLPEATELTAAARPAGQYAE